MNKNKPINYLDLFSGIGGFHLGLERAGVRINKSFYSEVDKYANSIYSKHFSNSTPLGDVRKINTETIRRELEESGAEDPRIHLVTFGFPCQDLSVAGNRKGLEGKRSSLFFEAMRIIKELQPDYFIFENVKGLLSSRQGEDFKIILQEITDAGYDGEWQLVNTSWFLPQNRERVYFVGYPRNKPRPEVFPITGASKQTPRVQRKANKEQERVQGEVPQEDSSDELPEGGRGRKGRSSSDRSDRNLSKFISHESQGCRVYKTDGTSTSLTSNSGGLGAKTGLYAIPVLTPDRLNKRQNGRRFKEDGDPSFTVTTQDRHGVFDGHFIRRLTPLECERLQGFPDEWTKNLSDTQRYKCLGNAVTVDVVESIIKKLFKYSVT